MAFINSSNTFISGFHVKTMFQLMGFITSHEEPKHSSAKTGFWEHRVKNRLDSPTQRVVVNGVASSWQLDICSALPMLTAGASPVQFLYQ